MKSILIAVICLIAVSCNTPQVFDRSAGSIHLSVDAKGRVTSLADAEGHVNYIAPDEPTYLIGCSIYEADSASAVMYPFSADLISDSGKESLIRLSFTGNIKIDVKITACENYFRMELAGADPVSDIRMISWGPYHTTMKGLFGEWLGLNRSDDFTLGLLTLDPNTDGIAAKHTPYGSEMQLVSYDHTRGMFVGKDFRLRNAAPIPGRTIIGSTVALFGCLEGKDNELTAIEKIELAENLPHPVFDGKWNKRSREGQKFCIWANYTEENFDEHLAISRDMSARILCRPGGFFKNFGHFEINRRIYPGGIEKIREHSAKARSEGIGLTGYTLTTFITPLTDPEPYISPVPDDRLQTWKARVVLLEDIGASDSLIYLKNTGDVRSTLAAARYRILRIDDEMIEFKDFEVEGDRIVAVDCRRGVYNTNPAAHKAQDNIRIMYVAGFHNLYPGTLDMSNECSGRLGSFIVAADLDNFVVDGFESCLETGYGEYTGNVFLKNFYDICTANSKQTLVTGSIFSAYTWHVASHFAWGEGDMERGFRGTMLDYRLYRQLQLSRNLMPYKMGQYYPDNATADDVRWLMALLAGWDSGVDFSFGLDNFRKNPEYDLMLETFRLWEKARDEKAFTEEQKMKLRQTDVLYKLSKDQDGKWLLEFDRRWLYDKINILPPSVMNARPADDNTVSVRPCSIDWTWTHNPGIYNEVGLSDDLIHLTGEKSTSWNIDFPAYKESKRSHYPTSDRNFQFVIRVPEDAPCPVRNFRITVDDQVVDVPVILNPGQYISTPHIMELACIYNSDHCVAGEVYLHGKLPRVFKGKTSAVSLSCEPVEKGAITEVIMNARLQNGYFHIY